MSATSIPEPAGGRIHPAALALAVALHGMALAGLAWFNHSLPASSATPLTLEAPMPSSAADVPVAESAPAADAPEPVVPVPAPDAVPPPPLEQAIPPAPMLSEPPPPLAIILPPIPMPQPPPAEVPSVLIPLPIPVPAPAIAPEPAPAQPSPPRLQPPRPAPPRPPRTSPPRPREERPTPAEPRSGFAPNPAPSPAPAVASPAPSSMPSPAPAAPVAAGLIGADWRASLGAWLQSHRSYPDEARRRGEEGRVMIRFTASRDGRVLDFELVTSSGSEVLDEAARAMFRNARLPAFPASMDQGQVTATVPIRFSLER